MAHHRVTALLLALTATALCSSLLMGQVPESVRSGQPPQGLIAGIVVDARTGEPVSVAHVRLREAARSELSHRDGSFHFDRIPSGSYTLLVERMGYAPAEQPVEVAAGVTTRTSVRLTPSVIDLVGLVVTGTGTERGAAESYRPTNSLSGAELRRKLSSSVAATLAGEPGVTQRYNGPAAAQPIIRGLGGDRVLVLEDGQRTGDLSSTSADHAIAIEALTSERIEVVRGPAGLLYGSNALGGVVNVIREEIPRTVPDRLTGVATGQLESVNRGATGGFAVTAPVGHLAVRAEASARTAGNTRTPSGILPTSSLDGYNVGVGGSWVGSRGYIGLSGRDYALRYGVPGTFEGAVIPGAHEGGVEVDMRRSTGRLEAAVLRGMGPFESIELDASYTRFDQDELELGGPGAPVVGTQFRQFLRTGELLARHDHATGGLRLRGAAGLSALGKNFSTAGARTGSAPAEQVSFAGFLFEEFALEPLHLEIGGRYDWTRISPREEGMKEIGLVRTREFGAISGSVSALIDIWSGWSAGASASRAFRTPAIEELFSNGPHLANYSYNVGNPDLESEYGLGVDLFIRVSHPRLSGELSTYRNAISNYIYHAPTGELDPRSGEIPVYQAAQDDAVLTGYEGRAQWEFLPRWVADASATYVRGTRKSVDGSEPLPEIPPLTGSFGIRHDASLYFAGASWEAAAAQNRVPETAPGMSFVSPFDQPTPGYGLLDAVAGLRWDGWGQLHTLTLRLSNIFDTSWRDHLSRIKPVAPQPGRNIQLLYRVDF